ncbi:MAG TPA: PIN domain-containing protein [Balneolaceae bacterium]|nr:PIN domain-containing protein [Balneolaceae bacterium]
MIRLFLDVNVILDYSLKRPECYKNSKIILQYIIEGRYRGVVSPVVIHIASHILKKHLGSEKTKIIILALLNDVRVIETPHEVIEQVMNSDWNDIEDAIQYYTALYHKVDFIISRDSGMIKKAMPSLPVIHPLDFLNTENLI